MNQLIRTAHRLAVSTLLFVIMLTAGCSKSPKEQILGTWQADKQNIVEFFEDGTFSLKTEGQTLNGKWLILSDGRIKIDVSMFGVAHSQVGALDFGGKEMTITDDSGEVTRHTRLK